MLQNLNMLKGERMKEWEIRIKEKDKWVSIGVFNKMQAHETVKEYMKTDYSVLMIPIQRRK